MPEMTASVARIVMLVTSRNGGGAPQGPASRCGLDRSDVKLDASLAAGAPAPAGQTPAQRLLAAGQAAYDEFPNDCSGAVKELLRLTHTPGKPLKDANDFMAMVAKTDSGWRQVTMEEASRLADEGKVVIGGLANPKGHGHLDTVMPGAWHPAGGFTVGNTRMPPTPEQYPPAMSGSSNTSWPGTHSRGEKTVYDARGKG
jgi:hypothetical protein